MHGTFRGHRALRLGRHSIVGQVYLITFTTLDRRRLFDTPEAAFAASLGLWNAQRNSASTLLCWVLMPDHWHGLVQLGSGHDIGGFVLRVKSAMAKAANRVLLR